MKKAIPLGIVIIILGVVIFFYGADPRGGSPPVPGRPPPTPIYADMPGDTPSSTLSIAVTNISAAEVVSGRYEHVFNESNGYPLSYDDPVESAIFDVY